MGEGGEIPDGGTAVLWEDEDTRAFYENLPELKALIPSILYSDSEKATAVPVGKGIFVLKSKYLVYSAGFTFSIMLNVATKVNF